MKSNNYNHLKTILLTDEPLQPSSEPIQAKPKSCLSCITYYLCCIGLKNNEKPSVFKKELNNQQIYDLFKDNYDTYDNNYNYNSK